MQLTKSKNWVRYFFAFFLVSYGLGGYLWQGANSQKLDQRPEKFAGRWYFGNKEALKEHLDNLLKKANHAGPRLIKDQDGLVIGQADCQGQKLLAVVTPHAAMRFSGKAEASAFAAILDAQKSGGEKFKRIILLGPSHEYKFEGAALCHFKTMSTPLGAIINDLEGRDKLAAHPAFKYDDRAHILEHSLELEFPFIKYCLPDATVLPILVGRIDPVDAQELAQAIKEILKPGDLVLVSSDFTHYGEFYHYTPFLKDVPANIRKLDLTALKLLNDKNLNGFFDFKSKSGDTICGFYALSVLLAMLPETAQCQAIDYFTSHDVPAGQVPSEKDRSISYMAISYSDYGWQDKD